MNDPAAPDALSTLEALISELTRLGVSEIAFTGGIAVGVWTMPRMTQDFDLCAVVPEAAVPSLGADWLSPDSGADGADLVQRLQAMR